jgi:hypothetical protein
MLEVAVHAPVHDFMLTDGHELPVGRAAPGTNPFRGDSGSSDELHHDYFLTS